MQAVEGEGASLLSGFAVKLRSKVKAERQNSRKRRVTQQPVSADLVKTAEAAAGRLRARCDGGEQGGDPRERAARREIKERLRQRGPEPPTPLELEQAAVSALREQRSRARADGGGDGGGKHARALRRKALARLKQKEAEAEAELIGGRPPTRVAIVGAGPTGLWLAVLLARKHASFANSSRGAVISRNANAPTIHVFEKRRPAASAGGDSADGAVSSKAHGGRSIVLAITQQTQDLLNRNLLGTSIDRGGGHAFAPTSRIGDIETILAAEFERYARAGFGELRYGADVSEPDALHEAEQGAYDVVIVASGKRHATDEWRAARGMETVVEGVAAAAILEFWGAAPAADGWASVVASASRAISPAQIFVRPGADAGRGWVWLVGLPAELSDAIRDGVQQRTGPAPPQASLTQALQAALHSAAAQREGRGVEAAQGTEAAEAAEAATGAAGAAAGESALPGEASALAGLRVLDASLRAAGARAGWTEGSYWRSSGIVHAPEPCVGPTLLIGDACCGRPFWLGSTLNGHFADVVHLASAPCWNAWDWAVDGLQPFRSYLDRMRTLRRCGGGALVEFKRPTAEGNAALQWELSRRGLRGAAKLGGAIQDDLAKTLAAAEMRNRARAVGVKVNRAGLSSSSSIELH